MSTVCSSEKELANAIKNNQDEIIIEGDIKNKVIRIKAVGKVAWGACAASLAVAIALAIAAAAPAPVIVPTGKAAALVASFATSSVAAATLGSAVVTAVLIGVFAGGIGALNTLRDKYKIVEKDKTYIKLKRK